MVDLVGFFAKQIVMAQYIIMKRLDKFLLVYLLLCVRSKKNKYLLEPLIHIYDGRVDISSPKIEAFKYVIYRKAELFNLIDNYFNKYPLRTEKMKRVNLIKQLYIVRLSKKNEDIVKFNE